MDKSNPLGTRPVGELIRRFSIPSIISMLVNAIYNIVDQIFIGQGIGVLGIAATNVAFPLVTISTAVALLLGIGGASNFNLLLGREKPEDAARVMGNAITYLVLAGLTLAALAFALLDPLLRLFGATDQVMPFARPYTVVIIIGLPFAVFSVGAGHLIRADGSPRYAMICMLAGAVFNLIFDPIFLFVFDWGIEGIAWATTLGQVLSTAIAVRYMTRFRAARVRREHLKPKLAPLRRITALGAAAFFNQIALTLMQIVMNNTVRHYGALSPYGSEIPLAVIGIGMKINAIFLGICIGIAQGCQPIHGFNYGAKQFGRVKKTFRIAIIAATAISLCAFLTFQLFPRQLLAIFGSESEEYFAFGERYLRIYMMMTCLNGIQPVTANFFTSIGKATRGMFMSLTRQIIFLIPLTIILPYFFGINGVMYAGPIADGAAVLLAVLFARHELRHLGEGEPRPAPTT